MASACHACSTKPAAVVWRLHCCCQQNLRVAYTAVIEYYREEHDTPKHEEDGLDASCIGAAVGSRASVYDTRAAREPPATQSRLPNRL